MEKRKNGAAASRCCSNWSAKLRTFDSGPLIPRRCRGKRVKSVQRLDELIKRNVHGLTSWLSVGEIAAFSCRPRSTAAAFFQPSLIRVLSPFLSSIRSAPRLQPRNNSVPRLSFQSSTSPTDFSAAPLRPFHRIFTTRRFFVIDHQRATVAIERFDDSNR